MSTVEDPGVEGVRARWVLQSKGFSGIKQKFTSLWANEVLAAMKPDSRPMTFTRPIPWIGVPRLDVGTRTTGTAICTAVSTPKEDWIEERSLSTVLGIPMTAIFNPAS